MAFGSVYTILRFSMFDDLVGSIMIPAFIAPLPFMYLICTLFYHNCKTEFLRMEHQDLLIRRFRKILKEFPEQILISQEFKHKILFPFINDDALLNQLKSSKTPCNGKIVSRRSDENNDINLGSSVYEDTSYTNACSLLDFLLEERKQA